MQNEMNLLTQDLHQAQEARHEAERALHVAERRYRLVAENSRDLVGLLNTEGKILYASPSHYKVLGFRPEQVVHQNLLDLVHAEDAPLALEAVGQLLSKGTPQERVEVRLPHCHKEWLWVEALLSVVQDQGRDHVLFSARDITERKEAEEAIRQYNLELIQRNEELNAYAHTVAHELRNPLSSIAGFAEVLLTCPLTEEERLECIETVVRMSKKMNTIIESLLKLSRVRTEEVAVRSLDTSRLVQEARERLAGMIAHHNATLQVPDAWPQAVGYPEWVEEVWVNYLSNALKYGGVPPVIELGAQRDTAGVVRFWVRDNGNGFLPENQKRLFRPFSRLDDAAGEGYGLGLSIVRKIVEKLGGEVGVESTPGEGSTFWFTLPAVS